MKSHNHFVKRMCPVKIPRKSDLNHKEHEFYLRAFIKFQIRPYQTKHEEEEYNQYMQLQNKVFEEQNDLMHFAYKVSELVLNEYNAVPEPIENYIKHYVNHRCKRIYAYPQYFRTEVNIPIKPQVQGCNFNFKHLGHLLSLGSVPVINVPNPHLKNMLPFDESVKNKRRTDVDEIFDRNTFLYKCPVSQDPNAEFLAQEHNVNIVMSSSAFKTIADNQKDPFDNYWNIPVTIKSYKVKDEQEKEKSLRVVYIDKPLPKISWFPLEMKACFFKQSALSRLTHKVDHPNHIMNPPVLLPGSSESRGDNLNIYADDIFGTTSDDGSDRFESRSSSPAPSKKNFFFYKNKNLSSSHSPNSSTSEKVPKSDLEEDLFLTDDDEDETKSTPIKTEIKKEFDSSKYFQKENKIKEFIKPNFLEKSTTNTAGPSQKLFLKNADKSPKTEVTESPGFLDNLLSTQKSFLTLKSENHLNYKQVSSTVPCSLIQFEDKGSYSKGNFKKQSPLKPWSQTMHTDWSKCKSLKECPFNKYTATNVHYQLFQFENVRSSPTKEASDPLKILVRHNIHGLSKPIPPPKFNGKKKFQHQNQGPAKAYIVYPKLENQTYFGTEINNLTEITQQWASLVIRPNTTLLQVRVCVATGNVVLTDERTLETVLKEGKQTHIKFDPQAPLGTLDALFRCITKLPSGKYMIHHSPKTNAFISIMKEMDSNGDVSQSHIDTRNIYANGTTQMQQYKSSPWLNIDTHVLTPFHLSHKKIPATFPMRNPTVKLTKKMRKKKREVANKKKSIDDVVEDKIEQQPKKREREESQDRESKRRYF